MATAPPSVDPTESDPLADMLGDPNGLPDENALPPAAPEASSMATNAAFSGGMAGAQVGGPFPPARGLGAAIGAAGGYMAGQTADDFKQGVPLSLDRVGQNLVEAAKQGLIQGSAEMAFPVLGQLATANPLVKKGIEKTIGAVAKKVGEYILPVHTPTTAKTEELIGRGSAGKATATVGQLQDPAHGMESQGVRIGENIAYNSWSSQTIKGAYQQNEAAVQQAFSNFEHQMSQLSPKDAEAVFDGVVTGRLMDKMMRPMDMMMDNIRQRAQGNIVEWSGNLKLLRDPNSTLGNTVINGLRRIREDASDPAKIDKLITLMETPAKGTQTQALPKLTIDEAMYLKTELSRIANKKYTPSPENDAFVASAQRLSGDLNEAIKRGLGTVEQRTSDMTLTRDYTRSMSFYEKAAERYRNDFVRSTLDTLEKKPGSLARVLLPKSVPSEAEHLAKIEAIKAAYGPRWNIEMRPLLLSTLANRSFNEVEGRYSGTLLAKELETYGSKVLDSMVGPKGGQELMDFARTLEIVAQRPKGTGSVWVQLATGGALTGLVGGATGFAISGDLEKSGLAGATAAGITVLLGPRLIGNLLADPKYLKAMKEGLVSLQKTGRPSSDLIRTLRQAGTVLATSHPGQELTPEQARRVVSPTALPVKAGDRALVQGE